MSKVLLVVGGTSIHLYSVITLKPEKITTNPDEITRFCYQKLTEQGICLNILGGSSLISTGGSYATMFHIYTPELINSIFVIITLANSAEVLFLEEGWVPDKDYMLELVKKNMASRGFNIKSTSEAVYLHEAIFFLIEVE